MLFDHQSDPGERVDLGQSNVHSVVRERMEKALFSWLRGLKNRTTVDNKFVEEWRDSEFQIGQW